MDQAQIHTAPEDILAIEKKFLKQNLDKFNKEHPGRFLLIKGEELHGAYGSRLDGIEVGCRLFGEGPFLVRSAAEPDDPETYVIPSLALGVPFRADHHA